jgi:hypothetical protein
MRWTSWMHPMIVAVMVLLTLSSVPASALSDRENRRIEYLVASVENLSGAKFVRNGAQYVGKKAAAHLRMKLKKAGGRVHSAEDFIDLCASKSYLSGTAYRIVFSDGRSVPSATFFREKLREFDLRTK